jgi:hypothetical protein
MDVAETTIAKIKVIAGGELAKIKMVFDVMARASKC